MTNIHEVLPSVINLDLGATHKKASIFRATDLHPLTSPMSVDTTKYTVLETKPRVIKWIDGRQFLRTICDLPASLILSDDAEYDIRSCVLTGLANSLTVSYTEIDEKTKMKKTERRIILDVPSLETKLSEEQDEILDRFIPNYKGLKPSTSLMKILALKNEPDLVKYLFNREISFEKLEFNSPLGLVAETLSGGKTKGVPLADLKDFAGTLGKSVDEVKGLLQDLGISSHQIDFLTTNNVNIDGINFYTVGDLDANTFLFNSLIEQGKIDNNNIFIELDTVGKIIWSAESESELVKLGNPRELNHLSYITQRLTAGVNPLLMSHLVAPFMENGNMDDAYHLTAKIIEEEFSDEFNPFIYYPDPLAGKNTLGRLFINDDGVLKEIDLNPTNISNIKFENIRKQIIFAIAKGVCFGLRQKTESILEAKRKRPISANIVIYGGLPFHHAAWRKLIAQCFNSNLSHLDLPNSGPSASYKAVTELTGKNPDIKVNLYPIKKMVDRNHEYQGWKDALEKI